MHRWKHCSCLKNGIITRRDLRLSGDLLLEEYIGSRSPSNRQVHRSIRSLILRHHQVVMSIYVSYIVACLTQASLVHRKCCFSDHYVSIFSLPQKHWLCKIREIDDKRTTMLRKTPIFPGRFMSKIETSTITKFKHEWYEYNARMTEKNRPFVAISLEGRRQFFLSERYTLMHWPLFCNILVGIIEHRRHSGYH